MNQPAKDIEIWQFAKQNNFTILTHDDDFEKLLLLKIITFKRSSSKSNNFKNFQ
ncbi:DUF5615 family PIN-like protein [Flavobacterium aquidurense]|uniref:DUF5615 family PIN-like protein n=1 Tax=Flavobacterium aquidurense TaxID=362413 RepID=UPI00371B362C